MTAPDYPLSPDLPNALNNISRSVDNFSEESRNLRESVLAGTIQRVRYARYGAVFAALATLLVIVSILLSGYQVKTILDARQSRNAQFQQSVKNQQRIEKSTVVSSFCAADQPSVTEYKSCLVRNGITAPDIKE